MAVGTGHKNVLLNMHLKLCTDFFLCLTIINLAPKKKSKLFDTLESSVLNYSPEIWGLNEGKDIEIIHTKFLRIILCVNKSTNLAGLYGELGRVPLQVMKNPCFITG